jgi:transcriptional regulator with GAF, ATPase, and Fis domain
LRLTVRHPSESVLMYDNEECELVGSSPAIVSLRREIAVAAQSGAKVLITGESGVGKDVTARVLHRRSKRRSRPFRAINCSSVPDSLLESELFGHVRGSFTGAVRDHKGVFESAHGGTVLLDEVGDSSARMQGLLLRFLQFGELQKIGQYGSARYVDVRVVATTRRDLLEQVSEGEFRLDLYYRLNVIRIHVPPLRDRVEDIPDLIDHFAARFSQHYGMPCPVIAGEAMTWLTSYGWPGNVRELRNLVERFVITGKAGGLDPAWLAGDGDVSSRSRPTMEFGA